MNGLPRKKERSTGPASAAERGALRALRASQRSAIALMVLGLAAACDTGLQQGAQQPPRFLGLEGELALAKLAEPGSAAVPSDASLAAVCRLAAGKGEALQPAAEAALRRLLAGPARSRLSAAFFGGEVHGSDESPPEPPLSDALRAHAARALARPWLGAELKPDWQAVARTHAPREKVGLLVFAAEHGFTHATLPVTLGDGALAASPVASASTAALSLRVALAADQAAWPDFHAAAEQLESRWIAAGPSARESIREHASAVFAARQPALAARLTHLAAQGPPPVAALPLLLDLVAVVAVGLEEDVRNQCRLWLRLQWPALGAAALEHVLAEADERSPEQRLLLASFLPPSLAGPALALRDAAQPLPSSTRRLLLAAPPRLVPLVVGWLRAHPEAAALLPAFGTAGAPPPELRRAWRGWRAELPTGELRDALDAALLRTAR